MFAREKVMTLLKFTSFSLNYYPQIFYIIHFERAGLDMSNEMIPDKLVSGFTIDTLIKTSMFDRDWQRIHAQIQSFEHNIIYT